MSYKKLGDICNELKIKNNIIDIYQPIVRDNLLYFDKIGESNRINDILFNKINNNMREITVYSKTFKETELQSVLNKIDILTMKIRENENEEILIFSFVCDNDINFHTSNKGKYIIEEEIIDSITKQHHRILLREYPYYPGDNKIANLMLRIYIE